MSTSTASALAAAGSAVLLAAALGAPACAQSRGDVVASRIGDIDPLLVGAMTPEEGGLPDTLWSGSDLEGLVDAASRSPGETGFLAASALAAHVLSSAGHSPGGPGEPMEAARARVAALYDVGRIDAADAIVAQTPRGLDDPELASFAVRARLAKGEVTPACRVGEMLTEGRDGAFWLRLRAACYAWAGESAAAELTLDLAREAEPEAADGTFTAWVLAAAAGRPPANASAPRDALEAALALSAGYSFDAEGLERLALPAAAGLARREEVAPELRARAALRAARSGAVDASDLSDALEAMSLVGGASPAERIASAETAARPLAEALLHDAAMAEDAGPFEVSAALDAALARAETPAEFIMLAQAYATPLEALPPSPELADVAPRFVLAAAAIGDRGLANRWLNPSATQLAAPAGFDAGPAFDGLNAYFTRQPDLSDSPLEPVARADAYAVAAAADPRANAAALAEAAETRLASTAGADAGAQAAARRDALVLLALGADSSPALRRAAAAAAAESHDAGDLASQALVAAQLAADAGAVGEAALFASEALGEAGPAHAPTAAAVIEILRGLGLGADARAVAVETMLATRIAAAGVGD